MHCNVCGAALAAPIYTSAGDRSITSLCEVHPEPTLVFFCEGCGHALTRPLADVDGYYDQAYRILIDSEDEDQIYQVVDGRLTYRIEHQAATLREKLPLAAGARVLDYGCAKGATLKRVLAERPDLEPYLFDVSEMYVPFWEKFVPRENWATYRTPPAWEGQFDLVTSFFALEHVPDLSGMLSHVRRLLKPDGTFYFIVPNPYANPADLIVIDHVNHFSAASIALMLARAGFAALEIDASSHQGAFVVVAQPRAAAVVPAEPASIAALRAQALALAAYWREAGERVRAFEAAHQGSRTAIYGSGFYGTFLATCLSRLDEVACFLDQSPYRQGKRLQGKPIVAPEALPEDVTTLYVGLNPAVARRSIAEVAPLQHRPLTFFYL